MTGISGSAAEDVRFEGGHRNSGIRSTRPGVLLLPLSGQLLLLSALCLLGLGLSVLFSASFLEGGDPFRVLTRQFLSCALGLGAMVAAAFVNPHRLLRWAPYLFIGQLVLLIAVCLLGRSINGASRWLVLAGVRFQPSELSKVILPLTVAWMHWRFVSKGAPTGPRAHVLWTGALAAVTLVGVMIALEPDYGTALFVMAVAGFLLFLTGMPFRYPVVALLALVPMGIAFWQHRAGLIASRFSGFLGDEKSYQLSHSLNGVATGGVWGKGFGLGWEKLDYLPEHYNDFIFAVFAEETGLVGVILLIGLYSLFLWSGWAVVRRCTDPTLRILGIGLVVNVILQATINIAVATGSAPTKGIPLPFISHGSSGLSVTLFEVGILLAIARAGTSTDRRETRWQQAGAAGGTS